LTSATKSGAVGPAPLSDEELNVGKIVSNFFISLDGVVESPEQWHFPYFDDEMGAIVGEGMAGVQAFLMGRTLYDEWADYWPQSKDEPIASVFNDMPKYVVSNSLVQDKVEWNNTTLVTGDVAGQLREIKQQADGDIGMSGSATLVRWLLANDLLDELALLVHPIVVGHGQRLFVDTPTHPLELVRSNTLGTGVLHLVYKPAAL
jgi:dihydrofolate reductase